MVAGADMSINGATAGEYPLGRTTLPVKDVGRLLLLRGPARAGRGGQHVPG